MGFRKIHLNRILLVVFTSFAIALLSFSQVIDPPLTLALENESPDQKLERIRKQIEEAQKLLDQTKLRKVTLQNEIVYQDQQIQLTTLKIQETEEEITALTGQISRLENALTDLSEIFTQRVVETYKIKRLGDSLTLLISSSNVSDFISRFYYLQKIAQQDRNTLIQMQTTQTNYEGQREKREELRKKLEGQKTQLAAQKIQKQNLLEVTKNDEKRFQQMLSAARAELEAIQAIIAGRGKETEVGKVSAGQRIASMIPGTSCNSSGTHLHFIVSQNGATQNPFGHLRGGIDYENCSGSGACSEGDPFNPSGFWDWPISPKIRFFQGYGSTWAVTNTWVGGIYKFHNGIDVNSASSSEVRAVRSGTLYRGSYAGSSCSLRYVRVDHEDSDLDTFYLHVDY
ncbi:MAG: hypothetical protein HYU80_01765 [Candidatus Blackburnbacteria bacterium]|nr:hypothetical protein [Candidatus Blackburnbacteria bacterium]